MSTEIEKREAREARVWSPPPRYRNVPVIAFATFVILGALSALFGYLEWLPW